MNQERLEWFSLSCLHFFCQNQLRKEVEDLMRKWHTRFADVKYGKLSVVLVLEQLTHRAEHIVNIYLTEAVVALTLSFATQNIEDSLDGSQADLLAPGHWQSHIVR